MPVIEVDFTGVETGAGFLAPGAYEAEVVGVESRDGKNYPGLKFTWASVEPETEGQRSDMWLSLAPKALWKFKGVLEAFGSKIPQSVLRFNTDRLIGKRAVIQVIDEPWTDADGVSHPSSKVATVHPSRNGKAKAEPIQQAPASDVAPIPAVNMEDMAEDSDIPF